MRLHKDSRKVLGGPVFGGQQGFGKMAIRHLAIIPDGNRRWAMRHGIGKKEGYELGIRKIGYVLKWCKQLDIRMVSMWGFSTENFLRDSAEVSMLFGIFSSKLETAIRRAAENEKYQVRVRFIGRPDYFPKDIREKIGKLEQVSSKYSKYQLNLFFGYGGRHEILDAVEKAIANAKKTGKRKLAEKEFEKLLYTSGLPDPELIIRTSGEQRLSGFMPWQAAYSELYFSKKLWPDFSKADFVRAVKWFENRGRRFGK
ncbi:di-trans,poly-cis-decaprenylcistransferase [Candidatus Parvarchaeota archaeon]|nr:di-trans,poly-cis-decaprenylcistransferase [Candidatus Parvarchaeota archaeon]